MSYNLSGPFFAGGAMGKQVWFMDSDEALAATQATDYITDAADRGMTVGDLVFATKMTTLPNTTPIGVAVMYVSAIDADGNGTLNDAAYA